MFSFPNDIEGYGAGDDLASPVYLETSTCRPYRLVAEEASREVGTGLLSLASNDASPLSLEWLPRCWSEDNWLNHYLTVSDRNGVKACRLPAGPSVSLPCFLPGLKGKGGKGLLCSTAPLTDSPVLPCQLMGRSSFLLFFRVKLVKLLLGHRLKAHRFNLSKCLFLSVTARAANHPCILSQHLVLSVQGTPTEVVLISTDLECLRIKHFATVKQKAFLKLYIWLNCWIQ